MALLFKFIPFFRFFSFYDISPCILSCLFIRFYFVGDEDLLEIIGNSKNVARLQKHFKKMFAGVASINLNDDNSQVLGLLSKEGEDVSIS
jgi:hypothetical protein